MHTGDPCLWLVLGCWAGKTRPSCCLVKVQWGGHIPVPRSGRILWDGRSIQAPEGRLVTHGHRLTPWDMDVTVPLNYGYDLP